MIINRPSFNLTLTLILLLALVTRVVFLDRIPSGITNDELHFVLHAKAVFYRFTDMSGRWNPLSLSTIPGETSSELPFLLLAPFIGPLPLNLFTARLPFIVFSIASIYLLYLITQKLVNPKVGLLTALVMSINPWHIYVSRTSFDGPLAIFFFLLTLYLLLITKGKKIILIIIPAAAAFYCYIGTKILLVPFMAVSTFFVWHQINSKKYTWSYLILNILALALTLFFFINLTSSSGSRLSELYSPFSPSTIELAEVDRNQTLTTPLNVLFSNRYTAYTKKFIFKYLNNFSPDVLFLRGDATYLVSLWKHGYFYYLDILLILFGFAFLYSFKKSLFLLILSYILLSPLPEAIRTDTIPAYAFHSAFQYPFMFLLVGLGIYSLATFSSQIFLKRTGYLLFSLVYLISFFNFLNVYFLQYPLYQPEGFGFSRQVLSHYLHQLATDKKPVYILSHQPDALFRNYLFYTGSYTRESFDLVASLYLQDPNHNFLPFANLTFLNDATRLPSGTDYHLITDSDMVPLHFSSLPRLSLRRISDFIELYPIFGDTYCQDYSTNSISNPFYFSDLDLNNPSQSKLCSRFFTKSD